MKDYYELFSNILNIPFELVPTDSWTQTLKFAENRKCELIGQIASSSERKKYLNFTKPYLDFPQVIATKIEAPFIADIVDILDKKLGAVKGYAIINILKQKYPDLQIRTYQNIDDGLIGLTGGEIYGFIDFMPSIAQGIQTIGYTDLKVSGKIEEKVILSAGTRNDEPLLGSILNKVIQSIKPGEHREILNKHTAVQVHEIIDYSIVWKILLGVLLIMIVIAFWMRRMAVMSRKIRIAQQQTEVAKNSAETLVEKRTEELRQAKEIAETAKEVAETANQSKSDILMNMSHELRTPLNAVLASTAMITGNESKKDTIESSTYRLLETIDQILDFTQSKDGKLKLIQKPFALDNVLKNLRTQFVHKSSKLTLIPEIKVEGDSLPNKIIGDEKKLSSIINLLLENASKFCRNKPKAELIIKLLEKNQRQVSILFSLKDNGIGISKKFHKKIFDPFSQVDTTSTREFDGTGMGLSLSKQLVELMGGKIWVKSESEKGSTFHFTAKFDLQNSEELLDISDIELTFNQKESISNEESEKIELDISVVEPNLKKLNQALMESDPGGIRDYFTEINKYAIPKISEISEAIDNYEYEEAILLLKKIATEIDVQL